MHGDFNARQIMINRKTQQTVFIDFECCGWGPGAVDLCTMMWQIGSIRRRLYEKEFLRRYHEALAASGKVDPEVMTLEKITSDYVRFFVPRAIQTLLALPINSPHYTSFLVESLSSFIQDNKITPESVAQPYFQQTM